MPPASEPTPQDVAAVSAHLTGQPAPAAPAPAQPAAPQAAPAPAADPAPQMQPEAPTPQPAPTQQPSDPFESLFASEPAAPAAEPTPQAPAAPTEPVAPASQPTEPVTPAPQPAQPAQPTAPQDDYMSFDDYMAQATADVPQAPASPNPDEIDPNNPEAITKFFDDLVNTAVAKAEAKVARTQAIQTRERQVWDEAFAQYPSLRSNRKARDLVHNLRMGYFQRGKAITPLQAANELLDSMGQQYRQGVADNQVITTIESVQPTGGGGTPVPTTLDKEQVLQAVQTGGESALADFLDGEIKAGRMPG